MRYLPLYYEWMKKGLLPSHGLCHSLDEFRHPTKFFWLLTPDEEFSDDTAMYWGFIGEKYTEKYYKSDDVDKLFKFTPLRQNIVLFMAAMNGEL